MPICFRLFSHCVRAGRLADLLHGRKQQADEDGDDGDDDEEFDQREGATLSSGEGKTHGYGPFELQVRESSPWCEFSQGRKNG